MQTIHRQLSDTVRNRLDSNPIVALLGPRQCGKSTLARSILQTIPGSIYLDLELPSDLRKLNEPELFFKLVGDKLICLDEIRRVPELFPVLRSVVDARGRVGQFLVLGSASPTLIRQSSESLAGRISYLELTPFLFSEIAAAQSLDLNRFYTNVHRARYSATQARGLVEIRPTTVADVRSYTGADGQLFKARRVT